ncbi:Up-regulated during septation-domain-containing protein [Biscogniauxia mediterranea]|nr:Up-regulated during septation-domain-containing protein [Biscogniauxia mediterranea]
MQYPEARKYQLFPKDKQIPTVSKQYEPDLTLAMAEKSDKLSMSNGLRMRIKEHNLTRRRKVSVPELGPMTTVQEVAMDSPTIPGRPALHERSISSPVNTWRQNDLAEILDGTKTSLDESSEPISKGRLLGTQKSNSSLPKQTLSPKDLAPLTIPSQSGTMPGLVRKMSFSRLRSGSTQQEPPMRPTRQEESPKTRTNAVPYTPSTATTGTPIIRSATSAMTNSTIPTPMSAPAEMRNSPKPWEKMASGTSTTANQQQGNVDSTAGPKGESESQLRNILAASHKRGQSESGSIMERGRPRKRSDGTPIGGNHKRNQSKRSVSSDRRAFESLPQGWKSSEAVKNMDQVEVVYLQKQALGQALRFEVLKKDDVESLSKELRHLDERTEYLRRTYVSLRAGRRNLHTRICQYLRSPRVAKFSYESMLKQEEALAELDASIDDWVNKLDQAENRRTRVRQKLLEHVAAASTLSIPNDGSFNETLQQAMGFRLPQGASEVSTPPRSPAKSATFSHCPSPSPSGSPQRVVARVPSVIPELAEEIDDCACGRSRKGSTSSSTLQRVESIRIYADSDVYALLADVESEFTKLNGEPTSPERPSRQSHESEEERKEVHRTRSHDVLNSGANSSATSLSRSLNKTPPISPPAPSPPSKDSPTTGGEFFLTAAVFRPEQTTVAT